MPIFSLDSKQLREESTPAFAQAPVWGRWAAWLVKCPGCPACAADTDTMTCVLIWLPWYCVPRPSGACSGGQILRSGVHA